MKPLAVLICEDSDDDVLLVEAELVTAGYQLEVTRVETAAGMRAALEARSWDIVLSDYSMPQFNAMDAFALLQASRQSDVPFVIVSGSIGEERVVDALKHGVSNYVMKTNLPALGPVVKRELADARTRKERHELIAALQRAVQARDEFLSIASHELNTPLATLLLQAQALLTATGHDTLDARTQQRLEQIVRNAERLATLIDGLLDITRVASGRLQLHRERFDLRAALDAVIARLDAALREAGCELVLDAPPQLSGVWDRDRIESVLGNVLRNALKYGRSKPIHVELADLGDAAHARVRDHGIGIAPEDQARIFERFTRAVSERHFGGFGVGLWLSREIVEAHGGTISLDSTPGHGATFTVVLPKEPPG